MNKALIFIVAAEFWMTAGQIVLKKSTDRIKNRLRGNCWVFAAGQPVLWAGIGSMLIGLLFLFAALSSGELNFVYLLGSINYIFALFAAHYFLGEKINAAKLIGTLLITLGIVLTAVSNFQ